MSKQRLENARDYFENIVEPAYRDFMKSEVTFLKVFSLAAGLYHMAEWLWFHEEVKVKAKYGAQVSSAGQLWNDVVERRIADAGFIRDLNNAAKHVKLSFDPQKPKRGDPSTSMHFAANTFISTSSYGVRAFGGGGFGGAPEVRMEEGGREVALEPIATAVFKFWEALVDEFDPVAVVVAVPPSAPTANS